MLRETARRGQQTPVRSLAAEAPLPTLEGATHNVPMLGVWIEDGTVRARADLPDPVPSAGDAIVRVQRAGICGTDLAMLRGYRGGGGRIPGHEFVGIVEEGPAEWLDARVVGEINVSCRSLGRGMRPCPECAAGRPAHCRERGAIGIFGWPGAFAERLSVPVPNLHRVPSSIPDDAATFVEPLAAAFRVSEQLSLRPGARAVVVGPGRLGILVARALLASGASVTCGGRSAEGIARARRAGLEVAPASELSGASFDVAIDCTGSASGFAVARRLVRPAGTIVLKSTHGGGTDVDLASVVVDEITMIGSRCGPFPVAIEALSSGRVDVLDLIDARFPIAAAAAAYERAASPGVVKVLLET